MSGIPVSSPQAGKAVEPIFDHAEAARRKRRALRRAAAGADFLMQHASDDLAERLASVQRQFDNAIALFSTTPSASEAMKASGKVNTVTRVETDAAMLALPGSDAGSIFGDKRSVFLDDISETFGGVVAAPETVPFAPESLDLVVSLYGLHEINDLPGMLIQIRQALKPDGLFLGCMAGAGTLSELREAFLAAETELTGGASPRVFPLADVRDAGALLQRARFALPVADHETVTVRYDSMFALMHDLRAMGVTNSLIMRSRRPTPKTVFLRAAEIYAERFSDPDGRVRATFSTIWLSGWAPHASQQKPARPGSATVSLAKVLGK